MRGSDAASGALFSYRHGGAGTGHAPAAPIRTIVNEVLAALDTEFEALYEGIGRQSVAPERLLRASLLQAFYSVRSERQLMEHNEGQRSLHRKKGNWSAPRTGCGGQKKYCAVFQTAAPHARGGRRRSWNQTRYLLIFSRCAAGA